MKTHYRKAFNSPYLSSADIVHPTVLTVARVALEKDRTNKSKELFNTAYFEEKEIRPGEPLKPMILNVTNCQIMRQMCGSSFIDDWNGTVTVHVDRNVKFGRETVEGLRLMAGADLVTEQQVDELNQLIETTNTDKSRFLAYLNCESLESLPASRFRDAMSALKKKEQASAAA